MFCYLVRVFKDCGRNIGVEECRFFRGFFLFYLFRHFRGIYRKVVSSDYHVCCNKCSSPSRFCLRVFFYGPRSIVTCAKAQISSYIYSLSHAIRTSNTSYYRYVGNSRCVQFYLYRSSLCSLEHLRTYLYRCSQSGSTSAIRFFFSGALRTVLSCRVSHCVGILCRVEPRKVNYSH